MEKLTVKLSYTIINTWMSGNQEAAIGQYLGQPFPATDAMELGKLKHEIWEKHILEYNELHPDLGGDKLHEPITEQKYAVTIPLNDKYQILLRGIPDCTDRHLILDFKCGQTQPSTYVSGWQLGIYKLFVPAATEGRFLCFNPYRNSLSIGIVYLSNKDVQEAVSNVTHFGAEIINYLEANNLVINYKDE